MLRRLLLGVAIAAGLSAPASAETVTILMEGVPDTEYIKTLVPEFTKQTGIDVNLEVVNYAEMHTKLVPQLVAQQRQRFLERWNEAMASGGNAVAPEAAQDRALAEATAFAIRIDVAEEITRLGSHLDELERLIRQGGEIGKRLDFLIQELHREANTMGAKSAALALTHLSVDMKVLIEQMREQVQNIE